MHLVRKCLLLSAAAGSLAAAADPRPASGPPDRASGGETWSATPFPGVHLAVVSGKPGEGGPYVLRVKLDPGARVAPHAHPDARTLTVLSGEVLVGFGESFDASRAVAHQPGGKVAIPAGAPHFTWSREGAVVQEQGVGPTGATPVGNDPPVGGATPQAVWEAARAAYGSGDFRSFIRLNSPEAQEECLCGDLQFLIGFGAAGPDGPGPLGPGEVKEMDAIARRHGLSGVKPGGDPDRPGLWGRAAVRRIADKVGLYAELMGYLRAHRIGPAVPAFLRADLADVRVEGAVATASLGPFGSVRFDRLAEGWFIHLPPRCLDGPGKG